MTYNLWGPRMCVTDRHTAGVWHLLLRLDWDLLPQSQSRFTHRICTSIHTQNTHTHTHTCLYVNVYSHVYTPISIIHTNSHVQEHRSGVHPMFTTFEEFVEINFLLFLFLLALDVFVVLYYYWVYFVKNYRPRRSNYVQSMNYEIVK